MVSLDVRAEFLDDQAASPGIWTVFLDVRLVAPGIRTVSRGFLTVYRGNNGRSHRGPGLSHGSLIIAPYRLFELPDGISLCQDLNVGTRRYLLISLHRGFMAHDSLIYDEEIRSLAKDCLGTSGSSLRELQVAV